MLINQNVFFCPKRYKSCNKATFPQFMIGGKDIEIVTQWSHLGHIFTSSFTDRSDIDFRKNCFIGQANNLFCFFNKLDPFLKCKLFKTYCTSFYGCELWDLRNHSISDICVAWR